MIVKNVAKAVALQTLGHELEYSGEGVKVIEFTEDSPAQGVLQKGDLIKELNGEQIYLAEELVNFVQQYPIGDTLELKIERNGQNITESIEAAPNPEAPKQAYLGIYIRTEKWEPILPMEINFDTGGIGGPSAGLMFVLEIVNQLTEEDISRGNIIAGTGAIDLDGSVNAVGGVKI